MSKEKLEQGLCYLDAARANILIAEKIFIEVPVAELESLIHIQRAWLALAAFSKDTDQTASLEEELVALPLEDEDLPKTFSREKWEQDLKDFSQRSQRIVVEADAKAIELENLELHHLLLSRVEARLRKQLYRACGIATPTQRFLKIFFGIVAFLALACGVYYLLKPPPSWTTFFYENNELKGEPKKVVPMELLARKGKQPLRSQGVRRDYYSTDSYACLELDDTFPVDIVIGSDDGSRFSINREEVIDNWRPQGYHEESLKKTLAAGKYLLQAAYFQDAYGAEFKLTLKSRKRDLSSYSGVRFYAPEGDSPAALSCK